MSPSPPRSPSPLPYRRLTLLDLIGIVLASGLALAGWRTTQPRFLVRGPVFLDPLLGWAPPATVVGSAILLALAGWVTLRSLAWPRARQAQVGIMACWGAVLAAHLNMAHLICDQWRDLFLVRPFDVMQNQTSPAAILADAYLRLVRLPAPMAAGILVAGLVAWRAGIWQRSTDGLDQLGRWVALGLLLLAAVATTGTLLQIVEILPWGWGPDL